MQLNELLSITKFCESKIEVKHSIFISKVYFVSSTEEVDGILRNLKNEYRDATHIVPAYRLYDSLMGQIIERGVDDGEPAGTAGKPILDVLKHKDLLNVLVVVIRYFGGTLLGTGGLVKAYQEAALNVINASEIVKVCRYTKFSFRTNYETYNSIKKVLDFNKVKYDMPVFNLEVTFDVYISDKENDVLEKVQNEYYDNIIIERKDVVYF